MSKYKVSFVVEDEDEDSSIEIIKVSIKECVEELEGICSVYGLEVTKIE